MITENKLDELACFSCPALGLVKLQRYWVESRLKNTEGFVSKSGYRLEVSMDGSASNCDQELKLISPILDLLSIFCRQRILIHGWEVLARNFRSRFWRYPLDPAQTNYVGIEPKCFLVSPSLFSSQITAAIENYHKLEETDRKSILKLSYCLSPALTLRDGERFMALYRGLETIASKVKVRKELTEDDRILVHSLTTISETFQKTHSDIQHYINGVIRKISGDDASLVQKLNTLLKCKNVECEDLWMIDGRAGLSGIRNKLAHQGAHAIDHQGLAVATFHLTLLVERFVWSVLGLSLEDRIDHQLRTDEWLQADYIRELKENIFRGKG